MGILTKITSQVFISYIFLIKKGHTPYTWPSHRYFLDIASSWPLLSIQLSKMFLNFHENFKNKFMTKEMNAKQSRNMKCDWNLIFYENSYSYYFFQLFSYNRVDFCLDVILRGWTSVKHINKHFFHASWIVTKWWRCVSTLFIKTKVKKYGGYKNNDKNYLARKHFLIYDCVYMNNVLAYRFAGTCSETGCHKNFSVHPYFLLNRFIFMMITHNKMKIKIKT